MTEWGVVTVIAALAALGAAVIRPVVGLNGSITRLTAMLENLSGELEELTEKNGQSHDRLWTHSENQDRRIVDHDRRITILEVGKGDKT